MRLKAISLPRSVPAAAEGDDPVMLARLKTSARHEV